MMNRLVKCPPKGGVRYTDKELKERLLACSPYVGERQEEERRLTTGEIYNQIHQSLTMAGMSLERATHMPAEKAYFELSEVQAILKRVIRQVGNLSLTLDPQILDHFRLLPVLTRYFESYMNQTHIHVNFKHQGLSRNLSPEILTAAYYIIREALTDIALHSTGHGVTVRIWVEDEVLHLWIENYNSGSVPYKELAASSGIRYIEEHIRLLGGKLVVDSSTGDSTRLMVELSLAAHSRNNGA